MSLNERGHETEWIRLNTIINKRISNIVYFVSKKHKTIVLVFIALIKIIPYNLSFNNLHIKCLVTRDYLKYWGQWCVG